MSAPRKDSDNLSIIEKLRPEHTAFMNRKIRSEAELERAESDLEEHLADLRRIAGTDDLDVVRAKVIENYEANTRLVDDFVAVHSEIAREIAELDARG